MPTLATTSVILLTMSHSTGQINGVVRAYHRTSSVLGFAERALRLRAKVGSRKLSLNVV
jgi:hypothetical protein